MKDQKAKKGGLKAKACSEELVAYCDEFDGSTELVVALDAITNWDGGWRLENLPADAPEALRENLVKVNRGIENVRPALEALVKEIGKVIR